MAKVSGGTYPTFQEVYYCLVKHGPPRVVSSPGTSYEVCGELRNNQPTIVGYPRRGAVRIHEDCWGQNITCQKTRAGGIYNGNPSIYDWYKECCPKAKQQRREPGTE